MEKDIFVTYQWDPQTHDTGFPFLYLNFNTHSSFFSFLNPKILYSTRGDPPSFTQFLAYRDIVLEVSIPDKDRVQIFYPKCLYFNPQKNDWQHQIDKICAQIYKYIFQKRKKERRKGRLEKKQKERKWYVNLLFIGNHIINSEKAYDDDDRECTQKVYGKSRCS